MAGFLLSQKNVNLQLNLEILLGNFTPSIIPFSSTLRINDILQVVAPALKQTPAVTASC